MAKIYLNSSAFNNNILPLLNNSIYYLSKAINYLNTSSTPNDFSRVKSSDLTKATDIKKELENLSYKLKDSVNQFASLENDTVGNASALPKNVIPIRQNRIK